MPLFSKSKHYKLKSPSSEISPTRCTTLFNIFIYFSSLHISGIHVSIIRRKLLYLYETGICYSVWVASVLLVGF